MTLVLVVEDEPGLRKALGINLRARGYEVALAADGKTALTAASRHPPDAVILDLGLPDMDGARGDEKGCAAGAGRRSSSCRRVRRNQTR